VNAYTVYVDDNYHYMDKESRTRLGDFETLESAIEACKAIVDEYLGSDHTPGMTGDDLYTQYTMFGEDPFVTGPEVNDVPFSAWNYAKERALIICGRESVKE
jgi:hypothetical protein